WISCEMGCDVGTVVHLHHGPSCVMGNRDMGGTGRKLVPVRGFSSQLRDPCFMRPVEGVKFCMGSIFGNSLLNDGLQQIAIVRHCERCALLHAMLRTSAVQLRKICFGGA